MDFTSVWAWTLGQLQPANSINTIIKRSAQIACPLYLFLFTLPGF